MKPIHLFILVLVLTGWENFIQNVDQIFRLVILSLVNYRNNVIKKSENYKLEEVVDSLILKSPHSSKTAYYDY